MDNEKGITMLKGCPFCGNSETNTRKMDAVRVMRRERKPSGAWYEPEVEPWVEFWVECGRCFGRSGVTCANRRSAMGEAYSEEQAERIAIERWNRRAAESAPERFYSA